MPSIPPAARPFVVIGSVLVVLICLASMMKSCRGPEAYSGEQLERLETNAEFSAAETAEFLGEGTKVLLLYLEVPGAIGLREQRESFARVLRQGGINIVAEEAFKPVAGSRVFNPINWAYSWEELLAIVDRFPGVDALVSLAGAPGVSGGIPELPPDFPGLVVAFSPGAPPALGPLMSAGVVRMAVVHRPGARRDPPPTTPRERFDRRFLVVTPDTGEIPALPVLP